MASNFLVKNAHFCHPQINFFSNSIPPSVINNLPSFQVTNPHAFHDTYGGNENGRAKNYIVRKDHNTSQFVKLIGNEQIESGSIGSCNDIGLGTNLRKNSYFNPFRSQRNGLARVPEPRKSQSCEFAKWHRRVDSESCCSDTKIRTCLQVTFINIQRYNKLL